jgi:hypothetical protein
MLRRKCDQTQMQAAILNGYPTKILKQFSREKQKQVNIYSEIRTSYLLFHTPDPNHSATAVVAAGIRCFSYIIIVLSFIIPLPQTWLLYPQHYPAPPPGQP